MADDESHLLRRHLGGGNDQIALVFAIVIVGDDHDFAALERADGFCDTGLGHGMLLGCGKAEKVVGGHRAVGGFGDLARHVARHPDIRIIAKRCDGSSGQVGAARKGAAAFPVLR